MSEWTTKRMGDMLRPSNERSVANNQYPVLTSSRSGIHLQSEYFNRVVASKDNTGYKVIKKGQFTYRAMSDDGFFRFNRLMDHEAGIISPAYEVFECNPESVDPAFMDYLLNSGIVLSQIYGAAQGGTRLSLRLSTLSEFEAAVPPLPEQKKIAEILSGIDSIQNLLIQKLEILDNLLIATRDDLFLQGELSGEMKRLPISEFINSGDITLIQDGNHGEKHPKSSQFTNSGIPFVMASHVRGGRFIPDMGKCLSEEIVSGLRIGHSMTGDVLLTHKASVGETCVVPYGHQKIMLSPQVTLYRLCEDSLMTPFFLREWFRSTCFQREISEASGQSTRDYIGITAQKKLHAMKPLNKNAEASITEGLLPISRSIELLSGKLNCWNELRAALSADLLSGLKRVNI